MRASRSTLCILSLALLLQACGGKASQDPTPSDRGGIGGAIANDSGGTGSGGSAGQPMVNAGAPACADTPRQPSDEQLNAATLELAMRAAPATPIPLFITLADVPSSEGATPAEKRKLYAPSQDATEARLKELGATGIEHFWLGNIMHATVAAQFVPDILCWPDVLHVETDAPYWSIVDPPWSAEEAGPSQCPLQADGRCPEHCYPMLGLPYSDIGSAGAGCYLMTRVVAACSRSAFGIDDLPYTCAQEQSSAKRFLFTGPPPTVDGFVGWVACSDPTPVLCDEEG